MPILTLFLAHFDNRSLPEILNLFKTWFNNDNVEDTPKYTSFHTKWDFSRVGFLSV